MVAALFWFAVKTTKKGGPSKKDTPIWRMWFNAMLKVRPRICFVNIHTGQQHPFEDAVPFWVMTADLAMSFCQRRRGETPTEEGR